MAIQPLDLEPRALFDDLLLFPIDDPLAEVNDLPGQGYVVLTQGQAVLVDTADEYHRPALRKLEAGGHKPAALVLTHYHLATGAKEALAAIEEELRIPIFLHPIDAALVSGSGSGARIHYQDPVGSALLAKLGLEATLFPGHTPGHIHLRWAAHGGVLFVGDSAVGPSRAQRRAGDDLISRPPHSLNDDDEALRRSWKAFDRIEASFLPLHGEVFVDRAADLPRLMAPLRDAGPTPEFERDPGAESREQSHPSR